MNKLEKQKIEEVANLIYNINAFISLHYIGLKKIPTNEEILVINDQLAQAIRRLRNLV